MSARVVLLRGHQVNSWDLRPYEDLAPDYRVEVLLSPRNAHDASAIALARRPVRTLGDRLPPGRLGRLSTRALGERYEGLEPALAGADIVHSAEIATWFSWQAARLRKRLGFRLVLTVWETVPFRDAFRNVRTRRYRREVLEAADAYLATTERARAALLLEGAPAERIEVAPPGVDLELFGSAGRARAGGGHLLLSVGRLVWEKGHQDVLRALAHLAGTGDEGTRLLVVGVGPERVRLAAYARELGVADRVEFAGSVEHTRLPELYARASALVLASIPTVHWEEQFGMVLAEAMAARLPVLASSCGAIPEVLGASGALFSPGDWLGLADGLAAGPLSRPAGERSTPEPERVELFSSGAASARLRNAYGRILGDG